MGGQTSKHHRHSEPVYSFPQHELNHLRALYVHLKKQHAALDKHIFIQHLELPPILLPFGEKLFQAFIKAGNEEGGAHPPPAHHSHLPHLSHHHQEKAAVVSSTVLTEHQFIVGVEKCCRGGISQQLRFLFAMYEDDSNVAPTSSTGAVVVEETERKEQIKAMLCDCTFLAKLLYGRHDTYEEGEENQNDTDEKQKEKDEVEDDQDEGGEGEEEQQKKKKEEKKKLRGTLEVTGEDLHVWEKKAINPTLEGLLLYNEREGGGGGSRTVSIDTFVAWASDTVTHLFKSTVEVLVRRRLLEFQFAGQPATSQHLTSTGGGGAAAPVVGGGAQVPFRLPEIDHVMNRKQLILDQSRLWVLSAMVNAQDRAVPWRVLYSTLSHGNSFNRFCAALFGYHGTTLLLIRTKAKEVFGVYNVSGWQDTTSYYGDARSFLFSLYPRINVYRTTGKATNYVYLNTKKTFSELPIGIGFGGDLGSFRLWIDKDFEVGSTRSVDVTYRKGPLMDGFDFEIEDLVVWGLGGEDAEQRQEKEKLREQNLTDKMRKVNRTMAAEGWNDGPNKWMMDLVGRTGASDPFLDDLKKDDKKSNPL